MKIAVMGAGAVGCYYGGMLARAGHEVTLIARAHHATAINASGLLLETQAFTQRVRVAASTDASAVRGAQWVLFCVKSTDTESAGRALAPHLAEGAVVLSLQNGVDNAERLQATIGHPVIPAVSARRSSSAAGRWCSSRGCRAMPPDQSPRASRRH